MERTRQEGRSASERLALISLGMALLLFLLGVNWPALLHLAEPGPWFPRVVHWTWIGLTGGQAFCVFNGLLLAGDESGGRGLAMASVALSGLFMGLGVCLGSLAFCLGVPLVLIACAGQLFVAIQVSRRDVGDAEGAGGWTLLAWLAPLATPVLGGFGVLGAMPRLF